MAKIQFSILCESFDCNFDTKMYSIKNAFERLILPKFPIEVNFALVIYWIGDIEEIRKPPVTASIINKNGEKMIGAFSAQINVSYESHFVSFCVFENMTFPTIGTYFVNIEIDGITNDSIPFSVTQL